MVQSLTRSQHPPLFLAQKNNGVPHPATHSQATSSSLMYGSMATALSETIPEIVPHMRTPDFIPGLKWDQGVLAHFQWIYAAIIGCRGVAAYMRRSVNPLDLTEAEGKPGFKGFMHSVATKNWSDVHTRWNNFKNTIGNEVRETQTGWLGWGSWFYGSSMVVGLALNKVVPSEFRDALVRLNPHADKQGFSKKMAQWNPVSRFEFVGVSEINRREKQVLDIAKEKIPQLHPENVETAMKEFTEHTTQYFEQLRNWRKIGSSIGHAHTVILLAVVMTEIQMIWTGHSVKQQEERRAVRMAEIAAGKLDKKPSQQSALLQAPAFASIPITLPPSQPAATVPAMQFQASPI
jgi:hypothetical protein